MVNKEKKECIYRVIKCAVMIVGLVIFLFMYDFNVVREFIYSNF